MSWISTEDGPTKGRHEEVPKALRGGGPSG